MPQSFSYEDAFGLPSADGQSGGASNPALDASTGSSPVAAPADPAAPSDRGAPPLIVHGGGRQAAATGSTSPATAPSATSQTFSYEDAFGLAPADPGVLSNSPDDNGWTSTAKSIGTGLIKGLANIPGTVGNISNLADTLVAGGEHLFTGQSIADIMTDMKTQRAQQEAQNPINRVIPDPRSFMPTGDDVAAPMLKQTGEYQPTTGWGRAGQAGVEALAAGIGPGAGSAVIGAPLKTIAMGAAKMAPANFVAGAASQGTTDATGNPYLGMLAGVAAPAALDTAVNTGIRGLAGRDMPGGAWAQGQQDASVGRKVLGLANDPQAVQQTLLPDAATMAANPSSSAVPGFKPTTGQLTGDMGLLQAESRIKADDNTAFNIRAGQQNTAATDTLRRLSPDADPMAVTTTLQQHLDTLDQATSLAQQRITDGAQQLAGTMGSGMAPEDAGAAIRGRLETMQQRASDFRNRLYAAVDPDGSLGAVASPVRAVGNSIVSNLDPYGVKLSREERDLFGLAQQMPDVLPYRSLVEFDKNINDALPTQTGVSRARLGQLKSAVMDALDGSVAFQGQKEASEIAGGTRSPDDTMANRLDQATGSQQTGSTATSPQTGSAVFTPAGRRIDVDYQLADTSDLTASHSPDLTPNPDYPANLQPRNRSRAASGSQIADIASNLQPERLGASTSSAEGAPIVGPDGLVESGNGRVLAIQRAHAQNGPRSQAYRDYLEAHGFDTSGVASPILVRRRLTPMAPEERVRFAQESNASPVLAASATERAATDAGRLSDGVLAQYQGGDVGSAANRPFVRSFLQDVAERGEAGSFAAPDGALSLDGSRRVQNALLHAGYGDSGLVSSLAETGDPDIAAFGHVMADRAGRMAQLRRGIAAGHIDPGADLSAPVLEAGRIVQRARANGMKLSDAVAQSDAFNPISESARHVLRAGYGQNFSGRLSRARLGHALNSVLDDALQQSAEARLFGQPLTAEQMLEGTTGRYVGSDASSEAAGRQPADGQPIGPSTGEGRPQGGRPGPGAGGPRGTGPGGAGSDLTRQAPSRLAGPEEATKIAAAKQAHKDLVRTFEEGPVGSALRTNGFAGQYTMPASGIPARAFVKGDRGYEAAKAFLKASKNSADTVDAMTDYALNPLRQKLTAQGTVDPNALASWKRDYGPALRALSEVRPGFSQAYDSAAHATGLMLHAGALRKAQMDAFQKSAAGKFLGKTDPSEINALVGSILDDKKGGVTTARDLVTRMRNHPDALAGLQKAAVDYVSRKFTNASEAGTTGEKSLSPTRFGQYVIDRLPVLKEVLPDQTVRQMGAVGQALGLADRSTNATRNKGTSQTGRDIIPILKKSAESAGKHGSALTALLTLGGEHLAEHGISGLLTPHGLMAAGGAGAVYALHKLMAHGASVEQAMVNDAIMNPERFAHYISKVHASDAEGRMAAVTRSLRRELLAAPIAQKAASEASPAYAAGGSVKPKLREIYEADLAYARAMKADHARRMMAQGKHPNAGMPQVARLGSV